MPSLPDRLESLATGLSLVRQATLLARGAGMSSCCRGSDEERGDGGDAEKRDSFHCDDGTESIDRRLVIGRSVQGRDDDALVVEATSGRHDHNGDLHDE